jgi:hypothetical protein
MGWREEEVDSAALDQLLLPLAQSIPNGEADLARSRLKPDARCGIVDSGRGTAMGVENI